MTEAAAAAAATTPEAGKEGAPAPQEVKYELKLPEGTTLDTKHVEGVTEFAKANKLSNEQAQAILARDHAAVTASKPVIPEKYDLKVPEGSPLDAGAIEKIAANARKRGLSNEQAQAQADGIHEYMAEQQAHIKQLNDTTWVEELRKDPEIGGEQLTENGKVAWNAGVQWFGEQFMDSILKMGLNHHPSLVRGLVKIGKATADDKLVTGTPGGQAKEKTVEDRLYPDTKT